MYISHFLTVTNPNIVYKNIPNKENKKCKQNELVFLKQSVLELFF